MDEPDDIVRELVTPIDGAKAGDRIRYIQFVDSMYFAPAQPYLRARSYLSRYRGIDTGTLSGRQVIEARERDIERLSKILLETEYFDTARTGIRGAGVHGHSLRLDENGLMFDMLRRQVFNKETGKVEMVKDQIGVELDEPVVLGEPLVSESLKAFAEVVTICRPAISPEVAKELGIHESTVSRGIRDKYIQCSWGIYPMSYFFSRGILSEETPDKIKSCIRKWIKNEDKKKPFRFLQSGTDIER